MSEAVASVRRLIDEGSLKGGTRLGTVDQLASRAGVSRSTMLRAIKSLVSAGVLASRQGSAVCVAPVASSQSDSRGSSLRASRYKWQRIVDRIEQDILVGKYEPGSGLPPAKALAVEYGADRKTLTKALHELIGRGRLRDSRRGFEVVSHSSGRHGAKVLILSRGSQSSYLTRTPRPQYAEAFGDLHNCLGKAGIEIPFPQRDLHLKSGFPSPDREGGEDKP